MAIIQDKTIEKPEKMFFCKVKRAASYNVFYTPERLEYWTVLAETSEGAIKIAKYHFYRSDDSNIEISEKPFLSHSFEFQGSSFGEAKTYQCKKCLCKRRKTNQGTFYYPVQGGFFNSVTQCIK